MSSDNPVVFYKWPNGLRNVAGGTRNEIKLDRPWQIPIQVDPSSCPFCNKPRNDVAFYEDGGGWRLIKNSFTPYPFHQMLIPKHCWAVDKLRSLGGKDELICAMKILKTLAERESNRTLFVNVHIGWLAGQNVSHLHYHLVQYKFDDNSTSSVGLEFQSFFRENPQLVISKKTIWESDLTIGIGGMRAAQAIILPNGEKFHWGIFSATMGSALSWLVNEYNEKFKSKQGLPPDFKISLMFQGGEFKHGMYIPILNHWGSAEEMAMYEDSCPITLPWPHELTAKYLKKISIN